MPSVSVNPPKTPVTKGSNGIATATIPNVCKMPGPPAPFVPVPLPNIGKSAMSPKDYSQDVTIEGKAVAIKGSTFESMGDMASKGTGGGLISANTHGITKFVGPGSMDVKIEGKNVQLLSDPMLNNCGPSGSPPNAATLVGVLQPTGLAALWGDEVCPLCNKAHGDDGKLQEMKDTQGEVEKLRKAIRAGLDAAIAGHPARTAEAARQAQVLRAQLEKLKGAARGPIRDLLPKLDGQAKRKEPSLSTMMGVVKCKDHDLVYAATSGRQFREVEAELPGNFHAPKAAHDLATKQDSTDTPPDVASFGKNSGHNYFIFMREWAKLEAKSVLSRQGRTSEMFYPPGSCAAQIAVLHALDHGERPVGLSERRFTSDPNARPLEKLRVRKLGSGGVPHKPMKATRPMLASDKTIPPCGTCQVILTMLMCNVPQECNQRHPGEGVCHKC